MSERAIDEYVDRVSEALDRLDNPRSGGAEYEWIGPVAALGLIERCADCGAIVDSVGRESHDRFHDILNDHARAIAVLINSHIAERVHDRYDVRERIDRRDTNTREDR